eukprot:4860303-Amphidinium_carterae.2
MATEHISSDYVLVNAPVRPAAAVKSKEGAFALLKGNGAIADVSCRSTAWTMQSNSHVPNHTQRSSFSQL